MRDAHRDMPLASTGPLGALELKTLANYWRHRVLRSQRSFALAGRNYQYYFGRYNTTWHHERAVEVPVAWEVVRQFDPERVLEVGNVLPHYFQTRHTVLDKDEADPRVVNADVVDFMTEDVSTSSSRSQRSSTSAGTTARPFSRKRSSPQSITSRAAVRKRPSPGDTSDRLQPSPRRALAKRRPPLRSVAGDGAHLTRQSLARDKLGEHRPRPVQQALPRRKWLSHWDHRL